MIKYHEDKGLKVNSAQSTKKFDFLKNVSSNNSTKIKNVNLEGMHWMEKGSVSTYPSDILQVLDYLFLKSTIKFFLRGMSTVHNHSCTIFIFRGFSNIL